MLAAMFCMILFGALLAIPGLKASGPGVFGLHYGPHPDARDRQQPGTGTVREKRRLQIGRRARPKTSHHAGL